MLFVVDIGNTHATMGWYEGDKLVARFDEPTRSERGIGEGMRSALRKFGIDRGKVGGACLSSVVPKVTKSFFYFLKAEYKCDPVQVGPETKMDLQIAYDPPKAVGADRLANAVAAKELYGLPSIVADFGTATTVDVVSAQGAYLGGAIFPGLEMSALSLNEKTAQLPEVKIEIPPKVIGNNTKQSIQSGLLWGSVGAVRELTLRIQQELGSGTHLVATGGLSGIVQTASSFFHHVDPDLTLKGLRLIYLKNRPPV